jgi:hypothetical protein
MSFKTGETVAVQFAISDPGTSGLVDADTMPAAELLVNGAVSEATVAVTRDDPLVTGWYVGTVVLPEVTDGDSLQMRVAATVGTVTGGGIVWVGEGIAKRPAEIVAGICDELLAGHTIAGSVAKAIADILTACGTTLPAAIAALAVVPQAAVGSTPAAGTLTIRRGDQFDATVSNLLHLAGRTYLWWTVKNSPERQTDAQAKLQITEDDGLVYLLGEEYATPADGSLTVDDEAGTVQIELAAAVTSWLSAGQRWYWDLQILDADGEPLTIATGTLEVTVDVTRAIEPWEPAEEGE